MATVSYESAKHRLDKQQFTWLVTGVAGFIGVNLLRHLLEMNQIVIGIDNFSTGYQKNIDLVINGLPAKKQANFTFFEADICSIDDCQKIINGANIDYVLHQAALGSVSRSILYPEKTHTVNINGFLNLLRLSVQAKVKRFVFASSSSVYGDSPVLPKTEDNIGRPLSPYAVTKYTNELYAEVFNKCYGIETVGLRYFNVFGPHQDPNGSYAAVIPKWIKHILSQESVVIYGDGETSRDFCYVDNVIQANLLAALCEDKRAMNTVYNIAVGEQNSLNALYKLICQLLGYPHHAGLKYEDFRAGDIRHSLADVSKANQLLGYQPTHKLQEGLSIMLDWYQSTSKLEFDQLNNPGAADSYKNVS